MSRHSTWQLENPSFNGDHSGMDSLAVLMFPNKNSTENSMKTSSPIMAKKTKDDSQKMEELQTSYEAMKTHLQAAFDDIERLKQENDQLRVRRETNNSQQRIEFGLFPTNENNEAEKDEDEPENELAATL
jgi:regulator of replication initiation timing